MSAFDTIIRNGTVLTPDGVVAADLGLLAGRIAAVLSRGDGEAGEIIDATGQHVLPGAIDIHCHVRAPAFPERGTVESETRAAAAGGITTLFEMPISKPACNSAGQLAIRREHFARHALVNFGLYVAPGEMSAAEMAEMPAAGAIAFKIFTTGMPAGREDEFAGIALPDEGHQLAVLEGAARSGLPVVVHAETQGLLDHFEAQAKGLDRGFASTHGAVRPDVCEAAAVAQLLVMNMRAGAKLHIAHVTSALTVDVLRRFAGSSDFSAETCPHYLVFTEDDVARAGVFGKINPPVRSKADQDALWGAIADGSIGHVTTDHASFAYGEKAASAHDFVAAPPGAPGLEMLVPVMLDAVAQGKVSLELASALISANGARRFGLANKGRIAVGADADLMLVDLAAETVISGKTLFTHARDVAQLYEGKQFGGKVMRTIIGGRTVFAGGAITGMPGWGRAVVHPMSEDAAA